MHVLGYTITRTKAAPPVLSGLDSSRGWWPIIRESFTGAWQRNVEIRLDSVLTHPTVFACVTLIASDIAKMRLRLVEDKGNDVWLPTENSAYSPVLRKPNHFQLMSQFIEQWVISKLVWGNTYVLKQRDERGVVKAMYVLDPGRVTPMTSPNGAVYYQLKRDELVGGMDESVIVPAREIIHDRTNCLYHSLVGIAPLHASGLAAQLGLNIQNNSAYFFANGSRPSAILTAPLGISQEQAERLELKWRTDFTGENAGKVAVISGDMKYQPMLESAQNAQLSEQWDATSKAIATTFHVPFYLVGGPEPAYGNVQSPMVRYFSQAIQAPSKHIEDQLDAGLELIKPYGTEFNIDDLLWMDTATLVEVETKKVGAGIGTLNESRRRFNMAPVDGGDTVYLQQQNYSLEALAKRDASEDPFATKKPAPAPAREAPDGREDMDMVVNMSPGMLRKALGLAA